jgi:hypothetical protein
MRIKRVLRPERLRRVPTQFSWLDQRLVRERHIERCDVHALALYLLLVTVADAEGLSYYGEARIATLLSMTAARLRQARADLIGLDLIAFEHPPVPSSRARSTVYISYPLCERPDRESARTGSHRFDFLAPHGADLIHVVCSSTDFRKLAATT